MPLNWTATKDEMNTIHKIAERAKVTNGLPKRTLMDWTMDVEAVHCNGCPLRLDELLETDDYNFGHDLSGIAAHLDRETGELTNHFLPRYSKRRAD